MSEDSKVKILKTAAKLFARKGFDGARVEEIAKKAKVNKALIYYYFKSKKAILDELLDNLIEDTIAEKEKSKAQYIENVELYKKHPEKILDNSLDRLMAFYNSHKDVFTIMISELLKDGSSEKQVFRFFNALYGYAERFSGETGIEVKHLQLAGAQSFFNVMLPMFFYSVFSKRWCKEYGIDEEEMRKEFFDTLIPVYAGIAKKMV